MKIKIEVPEFHEAQQYILDHAKRFNTVSCGRRFGKDILQVYLHLLAAAEGKTAAHIAPDHKTTGFMYRAIENLFGDLISRRNMGHRLEFITGGCLDFWSLNNYDSIRGRKYHLATVNESAFTLYLEDAWELVIRPTLADYHGDAWFFSTPNGHDYYKTLTELEYPNWEHFHFTSYDNPHMDPEEFNMYKREMPELRFRQEYMAEFTAAGQCSVKVEDLRYYDPTEVDMSKLQVRMAVDLAISEKKAADFTAIAVIGKDPESGRIYIMDIIRTKTSFNNIIGLIKAQAKLYNPSIIGIEKNGYQMSVVQELVRTSELPIKGIHSDKGKVERFQPTLAKIEQHLIYINKNISRDFIDELLSFPMGKHDDMVDALAHALNTFNVPTYFSPIA